MKIITAELLKRGWVKTSDPELVNDPESTLINLASQLGEICPGRGGRAIEMLKPINAGTANVNSLSAKHGFGSFPLHTDGAHLSRPPHFIILACRSPGTSPIPTILVRCRDMQLSLPTVRIIESAVFLIRNGRRSFYSSIRNPANDIVRFDEGCMSPIDQAAERARNTFVESLGRTEQIIIDWCIGDVVIIDNWQILHGRGVNPMQASSDRTIIRTGVI
jgi:hypothetical protein